MLSGLCFSVFIALIVSTPVKNVKPPLKPIPETEASLMLDGEILNTLQHNAVCDINDGNYGSCDWRPAGGRVNCTPELISCMPFAGVLGFKYSKTVRKCGKSNRKTYNHRKLWGDNGQHYHSTKCGGWCEVDHNCYSGLVCQKGKCLLPSRHHLVK